jgi:hypothetical protein
MYSRAKVNVTSVILDKSVFQRIGELSPGDQQQAWNHLHDNYQVVIPAILIEEVIVNVADPGPLSSIVVRQMLEYLLSIHPCWMDDVFEIAFRELVEQQPMTRLPPFPAEFVKRIRRLARNTSELLEWVSERRASRQNTAQRRIAAQDRLLPREERREMADDKEFWDRLKNQFLKILRNPDRRRELLEVVLGATFRIRHADSNPAIDHAFARFTDQTFTNYYITLSVLMVRLAYMFAPLVRFKKDAGSSVRRFVGRSVSDQRNNPADEQYIIAAMVCDRLVTRDEGMKNVIEMFRTNGFTKCQTLFLTARRPVLEQLLHLKG